MSNFIKNFVDWFKIKPKLDAKAERIQFSQREIWMVHLGVNVGFEIDGKNQEKLRPCLIYKKLSHQTALIIPLTSTLKDSSWYSKSFVKNQEGRYCLNQIRMVDSKRLKYRVERVSEQDFKKVAEDFMNFISP